MDYASRNGICARYRQRRADGKPGWTDDYGVKIARTDAFLARHALPPDARLLDFGCGAGNVTMHLARLGAEVHGIDVSREAIDWARQNVRDAGVAAELAVGDVVTLSPYADAFFDRVIDGECLHMIIGADRARCLASVFRVLKPGGVFLAGANLMNEEVTERFDVGPGLWFDPATRCSYRDGLPYYYLSRADEFAEELRAAGFKVGHTERTPKHPDAEPFQEGFLWADAVKPACVDD